MTCREDDEGCADEDESRKWAKERAGIKESTYRCVVLWLKGRADGAFVAASIAKHVHRRVVARDSEWIRRR